MVVKKVKNNDGRDGTYIAIVRLEMDMLFIRFFVCKKCLNYLNEVDRRRNVENEQKRQTA